ncbi:helix-turn-helix transcriptional regulator [Cohnella sp. 56]|uniref:helix-turn-helix transcriptional regulator n=1 Tax=Cohnella sp. 56 TaxID=3113722 RepID=UPI0030E9C5F0
MAWMAWFKPLRWKAMKQRSTFMKLIVYFVSATVLVLAVSLVALYWLSSKTLLTEIGDHSESLLVNSAGNTAQLMEWSMNYAYTSSSDVQMESYALSESHSDFDTYTIWNRLMSVKNGNPSIDSVYLINDYTGAVLDSRLGLTDLDGFYDQEVLDKLRARKITDGAFLIPRTIDLPLSTDQNKRVITAIIPYETGKSISAFVLNVDADRIMALLQNNSSFLKTDIFVLNDKNEVVFSTDTLSGDQIREIGDAGNGSNGWRLYKPAGRAEQLLVYATTSINGIQNWRFYETIPKSVILSKIILLRNLTLILFFGLFFASLAVIVMLSRRVYSPIHELVQNVMKQHRSPAPDKDGEANELVYLSHVFESQVEQIHALTASGRQDLFMARERFIRELLGGHALSPADIRARYRELELTLPEDSLSVAIFRIDGFSDFVKRYSEKDRRLMRFAMANIIEESLGGAIHAPVRTADMGADHIAVIVPVDKGQSASAYVSHLRETQRLLVHYLSIGTTVACGKHLEGLGELHEGYMAAYEMTQERFRMGHGAIAIEEYADGSPNEMYHLPIELERQIGQAIQRADSQSLQSQIGTALASLRDRPYFECKMSLITFFMHIRRALQDSSPHLTLSSAWGLTSVENQIIQLETLEAVGQWMTELSIRAVEELAVVRNASKKAGLADEVDGWIGARLTDPNLTTKAIADELGLSVNYLRNLYKLETGRSITDSITEQRLNIICEELVSSDAPIEPIIQKYGFTSLNTFYVAFKKKYGITPANYRKANKPT